MLFFLGLLLTQSLASSDKACLRNSLMDVGTCAFDSVSAYVDVEIVKAKLAMCNGGGGGGGGMTARKVVTIHRPGEDESDGGKTMFMFGTLTPERAFEDLRVATTEFFGHDSEHTYDFMAAGMTISGMQMDFSVTDNESLANFLNVMSTMDGQIGVLTAMKVTKAPTMSPTEQPTEPILPNVEFPNENKFWDYIGVMDYEDDAPVGTWTNRNSYVPVQDCEGPSNHGCYHGECCLHFTEAWGRMYSGQNLDVNAYPWFCSAYWIGKKATSINMLVHITGRGWLSIKWTWDYFEGRSVSHAKIGEFPVKMDGNWNYECMNLAEITEGKVITNMIFHWPVNYEYPHPPAGDERTEFWLDMTSISSMEPTIEHRGEYLRVSTSKPTGSPTTPIVPLAIWTEGTQFFTIRDYEEGVDGWTNRNSFIPVHQCEPEVPYQGECVLEFTKGYAWGRMLSNNWDTNAYNWFCTGYRIPADNDGINMLANVQGVGWRSIEWTWNYFDDVGVSYPWIGKFESLVNDGKWRHGCFNAAEMTGNKVIHELIFHWPANHKYPYPWGNVGGEDARTFFLDDTTISDQDPTEYVGPDVGN